MTIINFFNLLLFMWQINDDDDDDVDGVDDEDNDDDNNGDHYIHR